MASVCVVGSLNVDVGFRARHLPRPGETILATHRNRSFGGKGGNQAIAAASCGAQVSFVGAVGDDLDGSDYRSHLATYGIDIDGVVTAAGHNTGSAMVLIDETGENMIVVDSGANATVAGEAALAHIAALNPTVVLLQLEINIPAIEVILAGLSPEIRVILNPAPMPADSQTLKRILPRVDLLVPNRPELGALASRPEPTTPDEVLQCLRAVGDGRTVVATLGADGAAILDDDGNVEFVPAPQVNTIDTTGAGDAFCGCIAAEIAAGSPVRAAVDQALQIASYSTTLRGSQLPKRSSVL